MESKLQALMNVNSQENKTKYIKQAKEQGKKVIGLIVNNAIPEEVIYAAGAFPVRMFGTWLDATPKADAYRSKISCRYSAHILDSVLQGEYSDLDGIVAAAYDDDIRTTWDVFDYYKTFPYVHIMYYPHKNSDLSRQFWHEEVDTLRRDMEKITGIEVTDERLNDAIVMCNKTRELIAELYELRKQPEPPLTGAEMLNITCAASLMPKDAFNAALEELMPYIRTRKAGYKELKPRVLVSSDFLDDARYLQLIEDAGCVVAMDDLDTGSRCYHGTIVPGGYNPMYNLSKYYLDIPGTTSHFYNWREQINKMADVVKEYGVDGIIELPVLYSFGREFFSPLYRELMEEKEIPFMTCRRDYGLVNEGQLSTRIGAFVEMIK